MHSSTSNSNINYYPGPRQYSHPAAAVHKRPTNYCCCNTTATVRTTTITPISNAHTPRTSLQYVNVSYEVRFESFSGSGESQYIILLLRSGPEEKTETHHFAPAPYRTYTLMHAMRTHTYIHAAAAHIRNTRTRALLFLGFPPSFFLPVFSTCVRYAFSVECKQTAETRTTK